MPLRIVMLATGEFSLPVFRSLYDSPHAVVGLFTQPDRTGRGHHRHVNPLKEHAAERGTPVFQPGSINKPEGLEALASLNADLGLVAAYGQILSADVINAPRLGCVNIHASLLPKYRGAAPIHYAILNGETETGVTLFQIEPKLDAGMILGVTKTDIGPHETTGDLHDRLAEISIPLTMQVLNDIEQGTTNPKSQDPALVTTAPTMIKAFGEIDWSKPAGDIQNHIRAMQPWPTPFTFLHQPDRKPMRIIVTEVLPVDIQNTDHPPGTVTFADDESIHVQAGDGQLAINRIRPEGKREMTTAEFQRGRAVVAGAAWFGRAEEEPVGG